MMRKISVLIGILLVATMLLVNHFMGYDNEIVASDYDIAMMHASEVYKEKNYENIDVIICEDTDDEFIHYECYNDSKLVDDIRIYRDVAYDCLTGYYNDIQD